MRKQTKGYHIYTEQEIEWIRKEAYGKTIYELLDAFNKEFGTDLTKTALKSFLSKHKILLGKKHKYSKEIRDYIIECYCHKKMTVSETEIAVKERFKDAVTDRTVHNYINNNDLVNGMAGRENRSWIKPGSKPPNTYEVGTIAFTKLKGRRLKVIKTEEGMQIYNRWLWEQHYGKIPEGHMVISLSRSDDVTDINDLICVSHSDGVRSYKRMTGDAEYNHNVVLINQLERLIEEREQKGDKWQKK